jgi:hypothetical protein
MDQMLKYGSWVTSGTAGARCALATRALDKHTITEHKTATHRGKSGKAGFSTSLMDFGAPPAPVICHGKLNATSVSLRASSVSLGWPPAAMTKYCLPSKL